MNQAECAQHLLDTLTALGHQSALVGGLAVSARTRPRFTRDIDFAVAVASDKEAEGLVRAMQEQGFRLLRVIEQDAKKVLSTVKFGHPDDRDDEPSIDLLFGSTGIEREIVRDATSINIARGISVPVARVPLLIAMKVLSESVVRDQDRSDLRVLLTTASSSELDEAERAVRLIEARGFNRDKDLQAALKSFIQEMRPQQEQKADLEL